MDIKAINRALGLATILLHSVLLAACGTTGGSNGGLVHQTFTFTVAAVPATGNPTYIDVQPLSPMDGLYGGGNARIESKSSHDKNVIVWKSRNPFWIRFESMKSNKGNGGNKFGPADFTKAKDDGAEPYQYQFEQELPSGGGKTESAKYFLTFAGVDPADPKKALGFVLDPVIIVDR
jgi:hypothetical protein